MELPVAGRVVRRGGGGGGEEGAVCLTFLIIDFRFDCRLLIICDATGNTDGLLGAMAPF